MIDTSKGRFGVPAKKLDAVSEMAHKLLGRTRMSRRVFPTDKLELEREVPKFDIGSAGHCFSSPCTLRLRAEA
jgi:hypothetical protein